jgi:hypothetical protein
MGVSGDRSPSFVVVAFGKKLALRDRGAGVRDDRGAIAYVESGRRKGSVLLSVGA